MEKVKGTINKEISLNNDIEISSKDAQINCFTSNFFENQKPNVFQASSLPDYKEVTKYLKNEQTHLEEALKNPRAYDIFLLCLQKGRKEDWQTILTLTPHQIALQALLTFNKNEISKAQFATSLAVYGLLKDSGGRTIDIHPLFDDNDEINKSTYDLLKTTFNIVEGSIFFNELVKENAFFNKENMPLFLNDEAINTFFDLMKTVEKSERYCFTIAGWSIKEINPNSIINGIHHTRGFNIFNVAKTKENKDVFTTPSFSMMQKCLEVCSKDKATKIKSRIDISEMIDLEENGLTGTREMALPFINQNLPSELHSYKIKESREAIFHDFLHAFYTNYIPHTHQKICVIIAREFKKMGAEIQQEMPLAATFLDHFYHILVDMDLYWYHPYYLKANKIESEVGINGLFADILEMLSQGSLRWFNANIEKEKAWSLRNYLIREKIINKICLKTLKEAKFLLEPLKPGIDAVGLKQEMCIEKMLKEDAQQHSKKDKFSAQDYKNLLELNLPYQLYLQMKG